MRYGKAVLSGMNYWNRTEVVKIRKTKSLTGKKPRWPMEMIKLSLKLMVINLRLDYPDRCACDSH